MAPWEKQPALTTRFSLKTDWSVEEKSFVENHPAFVEGIKCANKEALVEIKKEIIPTESHAVSEDAKTSVEIKCEVKKEDVAASVESAFVGDKTSPTKIPDEPKESAVPSTDPFDDVFDSLPKEQKPEPKAAPVAVVAPSVEILPNQTEKPKKAEKAKAPEKTEELLPLQSGFSTEQFAQVQTVINRILANITQIDLDIIQKQLPEYAVELTLDHYRENPRNIDEKIAEIKKNQDGIQSIRRQLFPLNDKVKIAWEYASKVGIMCSTASSAEKRLGQVMLHCEEIYLRYSKVKSLLEQCEQEYEHLQSQYEACSRLVSFYTSMSPHGMPTNGNYNGSSNFAPPPVQAQVPTPVAVQSAEEDNSLPFDLDDPVVSGPKDGRFNPRPADVPGKVDMSKVTNLESFTDKPKQVLQTTVARGVREIDF